MRIVYCHFLASCISRFVFRPWAKSNNAQNKKCVGELLGSAFVHTVYIFSAFFNSYPPFLSSSILFRLFYLSRLLLSFYILSSLIRSFYPFSTFLYSTIIYFFSLSLLSLIPLYILFLSFTFYLFFAIIPFFYLLYLPALQFNKCICITSSVLSGFVFPLLTSIYSYSVVVIIFQMCLSLCSLLPECLDALRHVLIIPYHL